MAEKRGGIAGRVGRRVSVGVNYPKKGSDYIEVPGISNFSIGQGEASSDTISAFEGSFAVLGETPIGDVNFTVVSYVPNHVAWIYIQEAKLAGDNMNFRIETPEREVLAEASGATIAIAKDGACTFVKQPAAFTGTQVQRGMAIKIGTDYYTISTISDDDTATVTINPQDNPKTAVGATMYSVVLPKLRWEFAAGIKQSAGAEGGVETAIGSTLIVTPSAAVGLPTIAS